MPYLKITTNQNIGELKSDLMIKASQMLSKLLQKPEKYVMIELVDQTCLCFDGNTEACAYLELKSIGLGRDSNASYSKELCTWLDKELKISPSRAYIEFIDIERPMWGYNEKTF